MTPHNKDRLRTAYTISVDAKDGVSTGISAADRAHTARVLADSATEPGDLTRPGHVFPLRYREGGVLVRRGHTEAAVDLATLAGLTPAGVLVEVVNDDGTMKRAPELREFADEHGLAMISHRGPRPLPPAPRAPRRARGRDPAADRARRLHGVRLPDHHRRQRARRAGPRRRLRRRAGADPRPLGVPDRRRLRQPPLRLRPPAPGGDGPHRRGGSRGDRLPARPRGTRDRPGRQAAGLRAPGRRPRHRRRQPRPRPAGGRAALRHRHAGPARPGGHPGAAADQQPRQDRQPRGLRDRGGRAGAARHAPDRRQPRLPRGQARPHGPRPARPGALHVLDDPVTTTEELHQ